MFTGIVTHLAQLKQKEKSRFVFTAPQDFVKNVQAGSSVSINGICLTIRDKPRNNEFSIEIMPETQRKTMLGDLAPSDTVNLELPATTETLLSGHIVQGHVDGTGIIENIEKDGNSRIFTIRVSNTLTRYIVDKGAISVNGISLTVIHSHKDSFMVGIIPFTWTHTMLHTVKKGDRVNIEVDVIAKYIEKLFTKEEAV